MGQAKKRGAAAQRQAEAIEAGRVKTSTVQDWHDTPQFEIEGVKKSRIHELVLKKPWADSFSPSAPAAPFHDLSYNAERFPRDLAEGTADATGPTGIWNPLPS